jgi:hypothetical protein
MRHGRLLRLVRAALVVATMLGLGACGAPECVNRTVASRASPDGSQIAVLSQRDCGRTSAYSTEIWLGPAATAAGQHAGNVFVADTGSVRRKAAGLLPPVLDFWWHGDRELSVILLAPTRVIRQEHDVSGIHIDYRAEGDSGH